MNFSYVVAGNNLFRQWLFHEPVLENFKLASDTENIGPGDFHITKSKLVDICWSYNIFQRQDGFYVSGAWADNKITVTKLEGFEGYSNDTSDLIAVGTDYNLFIVDVDKLKIWIFNVGEISQVLPKDLVFESLLERPQYLKIKKVVATNYNIMYLTYGGNVFYGMPPVFLNTSYCIGTVCDIGSGYEHCVLLTTTGHVYTWGCGQRVQLGQGHITSLSVPTEVEALSGLKITKIAVGGFHSIALSEFGDIYAWGWNKDGQLGISPDIDCENRPHHPNCAPIPRLIDIYDDKGNLVEINVTDIACGSRHSVIKLADNTIWATGFNKYGQLGLPPHEFPFLKTFTKIMDCDFNCKLMCGIWTSVLIHKE